MTPEALWTAVAAVAAIISIIGSAVAWTRANLTKRAKADAEAARDAAQRHLKAAEALAAASAAQADHLKSIGETIKQSTTPRPMTLAHVRDKLYRLTNNTTNSVTIEQIDNREDFFRIDLAVDTEIGAGRSVDFIIHGANGKPVPPQLELGLLGAEAPTIVAIPPK